MNSFLKIRNIFFDSWFGLIFLMIGIIIQCVVYQLTNSSILSLVSGISGIFAVVLCSQRKFIFYTFALYKSTYMVKKYIRIGIGILMSLLAVSIYTLYNRNQDLEEEISVSMSNQKASIAENSSLKERNRVFKFT